MGCICASVQALEFLEYFAGKGNCSLCSKLAGKSTASLDLEYYTDKPGHQNPMDILTDAGMATFVCNTNIPCNHALSQPGFSVTVVQGPLLLA